MDNNPHRRRCWMDVRVQQRAVTLLLTATWTSSRRRAAVRLRRPGPSREGLRPRQVEGGKAASAPPRGSRAAGPGCSHAREREYRAGGGRGAGLQDEEGGERAPAGKRMSAAGSRRYSECRSSRRTLEDHRTRRMGPGEGGATRRWEVPRSGATTRSRPSTGPPPLQHEAQPPSSALPTERRPGGSSPGPTRRRA